MEKLIEYLRSPLINTAEICRQCKINPGFMSGVLKADRGLPEKHAWPIMRALAGAHGFIFFGHRIEFDGEHFLISIPVKDAEITHEIRQGESGGEYVVYNVPTYRDIITDSTDLVEWLNGL